MKNLYQNSRPTNRPTGILIRLLQWLTNLELSGSKEGEQDIRRLVPLPLVIASMGKGKRGLIQQKSITEMKINKNSLRRLIVILILISGSVGASLAQTSTTPTQEVCPGTEPYLIVPDDPGNTFLWSILGGTSGVDWTITSPTTIATDIIWSNPATPQTYTVTFKELVPGTGCYAEVNLQVTVNPAPAAPTANDQTECEESPVQTLTAVATAPPGATIVWYDAATGGNVVANPILNTVGTITYYAESVLGTCVSATRTPVVLTINPAPEAPIASNQTECEESPIQTLIATAIAPAGATIVWYDAPTNGNVVTDPSLNTVGSVSYYAESVLGICTSLTRTEVILTIDPTPAPPVTIDQTECEEFPIQTLTATATAPAGATVVWYDALTGGNVVTDPSLNTVGTITYYAESVLGTCVSFTRSPAVLTINPAPAAPIAANQTECEEFPIQTITATATAPMGATVVWYDAPFGGNVVTDPSLSTVGTVTYYAESMLGTCPSLIRTEVILKIDPAPAAPTAFDQTACEESPIQTLTATATAPVGATIVWYDAATGGNVVADPSLSTVGTVSYYAESVLGTCTSLTRTRVILIIYPAPTPTVDGPSPVCESTAGNIYTTEAGMSNYIWTVSSGGTITAGGTSGDNTVTVTWNTAGTQTVTVNYTDANGCSAISPSIKTVIVEPFPKTSPIYHN